ncbi:MAG: hypothetical protein RR505_14195, partial [Raoultibacter sp.]
EFSRILLGCFVFKSAGIPYDIDKPEGTRKAGEHYDIMEGSDTNGLLHGVNGSSRRAWPLPSLGWVFYTDAWHATGR